MDMNNNVNLSNEQDNKENATDDFSFIKAKVKPKGRKKLKKALEVIGLTILAAIVFGVVARLSFSATGSIMNRFFPEQLQTLQNKDDAGSPTVAEPEPVRNAVELISGTEKQQPADTGKKETTQELQPAAMTNPEQMSGGNPAADDTSGESGDEQQSSEGKSQSGISGTPSDEQSFVKSGTDRSDDTNPDTDKSDEIKPDGSKTEGEDAVSTTSDGKQETEGDAEHAGSAHGDAQADNPADEVLPDSYMQMIARFRKIADDSTKHLVDVRAVSSGVNWMDESVETYQDFTGIIMGSNGVELLILTEYETVSSADRIELKFGNGTVLQGTVYSHDRELNLLVVAVPLENIDEETIAEYPAVILGDSDEIYEGQPVIAVGKPNGYPGSVEYGIITGKNRSIYFVDGAMSLFSTDMTYNKSSDGIVTNLSGELLGIITHTDKQDTSDGVCTVVGINSIRDNVLRLLNNKDIPYLGIRAEDIPEDVLSKMGIQNGVYVNEVLSDSPVSTELHKGDVIVAVGTRTIYNMRDLNKVLLEKEPGTDVRIVFYRSSRRDSPNMSAIVTVASR